MERNTGPPEGTAVKFLNLILRKNLGYKEEF